jgi:hypothetical protein
MRKKVNSSNIVTVNNITVHCKRGPFGNKFVAKNARIEQYEGQDELVFIAHCTADSVEPGRVYYCAYSLNGELQACNTLN